MKSNQSKQTLYVVTNDPKDQWFLGKPAHASEYGADTKRMDWLMSNGYVAFFVPDTTDLSDARKRIDDAMPQRPTK